MISLCAAVSMVAGLCTPNVCALAPKSAFKKDHAGGENPPPPLWGRNEEEGDKGEGAVQGDEHLTPQERRARAIASLSDAIRDVRKKGATGDMLSARILGYTAALGGMYGIAVRFQGLAEESAFQMFGDVYVFEVEDRRLILLAVKGTDIVVAVNEEGVIDLSVLHAALQSSDWVLREKVFVRMARDTALRRELIKVVVREGSGELRKRFMGGVDSFVFATAQWWDRLYEYLRLLDCAAAQKYDNPELLRRFAFAVVTNNAVLADVTVMVQEMNRPWLSELIAQTIEKEKHAAAGKNWRKANVPQQAADGSENLPPKKSALDFDADDLFLCDTELTVKLQDELEKGLLEKSELTMEMDVNKGELVKGPATQVEILIPAYRMGVLDKCIPLLKRALDVGARIREIRSASLSDLDGESQSVLSHVRQAMHRTKPCWFPPYTYWLGLETSLQLHRIIGPIVLAAGTAAIFFPGLSFSSMLLLTLAAGGIGVFLSFMLFEDHVIRSIVSGLYCSLTVSQKDRETMLLNAGILVPLEGEAAQLSGVNLLWQTALDTRDAALCGHYQQLIRAMELERDKMRRLNARPLPAQDHHRTSTESGMLAGLPARGGALRYLKKSSIRGPFDFWEMPKAYRWAAQILTDKKADEAQKALAVTFLQSQVRQAAPWAGQLVLDIAAIHPEIPGIHALVQEVLVSRATEGNIYIQTVLDELGRIAPVSTGPVSLGQLGLSEKNSLEILPFELSEKGRTFFDTLFEADTSKMRVSLVTIHAQESGLAIPYTFILKDSQNNCVYHLQVLDLSYQAGSRRVKSIRFPDGLGPPHCDDLYWDFHNMLKPRPGWRVTGAAFRLAKKPIRCYDEENKIGDGKRIEKEARIMYLTQPENPDDARAPVSLGSMFADGMTSPNYDKDILFNPRSPHHYDFMGAVNILGERGLYNNKDVGVVGTGQGADIIQILHHRPRSIQANDILPFAAIVSRWNVRLAQKAGAAPSDIPVAIEAGPNLHSLGSPDVVVWNTPVIKPDTAAKGQEGAAGDFANRHNLTNFNLGETDFKNFLRELEPALNAPGHLAVLRVDIDQKLCAAGETSADARVRYLRDAGLEGRHIYPSGQSALWEVRHSGRFGAESMAVAAKGRGLDSATQTDDGSSPRDDSGNYFSRAPVFSPWPRPGTGAEEAVECAA